MRGGTDLGSGWQDVSEAEASSHNQQPEGTGMSWQLWWQITIWMALAMVLVVVGHGAMTDKKRQR